MTADPKQGKRLVDRDAFMAVRLRYDCCAACGGTPGSVHHVVPRGAPHFGDDVPENLLLLCGSGTSGCHGAWHGSPYLVDALGALVPEWPLVERRDRAWVGARVGAHLLAVRPDTISYVLSRLGNEPGREFLRRHYSIECLTP